MFNDVQHDDPLNVINWFNPHDLDHLKAFRHLCRTGMWPVGFIPDEVKFPTLWHTSISCKLAELYVDNELAHEG